MTLILACLASAMLGGSAGVVLAAILFASRERDADAGGHMD
jgi:hypothetical protein